MVSARRLARLVSAQEILVRTHHYNPSSSLGLESTKVYWFDGIHTRPSSTLEWLLCRYANFTFLFSLSFRYFFPFFSEAFSSKISIGKLEKRYWFKNYRFFRNFICRNSFCYLNSLGNVYLSPFVKGKTWKLVEDIQMAKSFPHQMADKFHIANGYIFPFLLLP